MTSDFEMVTTVKREFARRLLVNSDGIYLLVNSDGIYLPSTLVSLVLEFANWVNAERKQASIPDLIYFLMRLHHVRNNALDSLEPHKIRYVAETKRRHRELKRIVWGS